MSTFFRSFLPIIKPPFRGLAFLIVIYIVWAHLVYPQNDVLRGNLPDPDDYMYLAQVLDWIKGQGWYDNIQHRLDPPMGTPIHFSRLAQLPMAAGILLFHKLGLPLRGAATVTALLYPLILLGGFLSVLRRTSAHLMPARWAGASAYVAFFSLPLLYEFMPGHVDHHGLIILIVLASLCCVLRLFDTPEDFKAGIATGCLLGIGMMIALETLPWVLLIAALIGLWSLSQNGKAAQSGAAFGLSFLATSALCLVFTRPVSTLLETDVLTYSLTYVWFAVYLSVPFVGVALAEKMHAPMPLRTGMGVALAGLCGAVFLHFFPDLARGPYGAIDPQLIPILLNESEEAKPILKTGGGWIHVVDLLGMSLLALPTALLFLGRGQKAERWKWGAVSLMLAAALGLTFFYQYRFLGMTAALGLLPLTALLSKGWRRIGATLEGRPKVLAEIGLLLLVAPLPALFIPALFDSRSFNIGIVLFPVDAGRAHCDMARLEYTLRDPRDLGSRSLLIASSLDMGPEILFRTDHKVLAAPFHTNVQGNLDAERFFSTNFPSESRNIAERRGIDLIVGCRFVAPRFLNKKGEAPSLLKTLFDNAPPTWLEAISAPDIGPFVLYRTRLNQAPPEAKTSHP